MIVFLCLLFSISLSIIFKTKKSEVIIEEKVDTVFVRKEEEFSRKKLKEYIDFLNIKHPDIVYAQAVLESGNFKSKLFLSQNNMFGMKQSYQRANTSSGNINNYASYSNWRQSVLDYALYQASYLRKLDREQYFNYLDKNYAEDSGYSLKLREIIKRYEEKEAL